MLLSNNAMQLTQNLKKRLLLYFLTSIFIVFIDQCTKKTILLKVGLNNTSELIPGIIQFFVVQNTGGAFSLFKQYPICFQVIGIVNVFIFSYLTLCPTVTFNTLMKTGCACILGGTIGNLIDRFFQGGVVDFLDLQLFNFAVFNLADVFIDLGVVLILIGWFLSKKIEIK